MKTEYKIEIDVVNYDGGAKSYVNDFSLRDLVKFSGLLELMKKNLNHTTWNWFYRLPTTWDGSHYVLDPLVLEMEFEKNWGFKYSDVCPDDTLGSTNFFKEFYLRFTPDGADSITDIKVFKMVEIL